ISAKARMRKSRHEHYVGGLALIADIAPRDWYGCQKLCWGAEGRGSGAEKGGVNWTLYRRCSFHSVVVADMVGPSQCVARRMPRRHHRPSRECPRDSDAES